MSALHILGISMASIVFLCFAVAGFEQGNFATWVDGAGISLTIYGLVRSLEWLISAPDLARDDRGVSTPSAQETAPIEEAAPQERARQEVAAVSRGAPPQGAASQETAPASRLKERIKQLSDIGGR